MTDPLPAEYLLLSAFSLTPRGPVEAMKLARLWQEGQTELTNEQRDLLHTLQRQKGQIRWVQERRARPGRRAPQEEAGYVLTPAGTDALTTYWTQHGPAHTRRDGPSLGEIARERLAQERAARPAGAA